MVETATHCCACYQHTVTSVSIPLSLWFLIKILGNIFRLLETTRDKSND